MSASLFFHPGQTNVNLLYSVIWGYLPIINTCVLHLVNLSFSGLTAASMHSLQVNLFFPVLNVCFSVLCLPSFPGFLVLVPPNPLWYWSFKFLPRYLSPSLFPVRQIFYFEILVTVDIIIMIFFPFLSISLLFIGLLENSFGLLDIMEKLEWTFCQPNIEHFLYILSFSKSCIHIASFNPTFFSGMYVA